VVILEAGAGNGLKTWEPVFDRIAAMAPVIAYDRRGLGKSAPDDQPQTLTRVVHSLRSLLAELNVPPPYVLVGHSWGGVIFRAFAREYGSEVTGLVYVDATDVDLTYAEADQLGPTARQVAFPVPQIPSSAPAGLRADYENIVQNFRTEFAEARAARPPSSIPSAVVISGQRRLPGATPDVAAGLLRLAIKHQQEWAPSSPVIVARHVGHFVHWDDPGLVLRLTRQVLTAASGGEAPPASNRRLELPLFDGSYNFAHGYRAPCTRSITFLGKRLLVSPRAAVWLQPDRQRFDSDVAKPGGLAVLKVHGRGPGRLGGYVEVESKTAGWVAGHVDLDRNFSVRGGVSIALP
jgi:pimeloyl-ACP methyl ester carboxylesterase